MVKRIILVVLVACLFRFWQLTVYPVSLTMDEVAIGYGSYSLLHTGRDEGGRVLPVAFTSVGDYKPPINYYLAVPAIAAFDLSEFAVRFPVAVLGSLSAAVFIIFLRRLGYSANASAFGGLWLAILPWHVHYSRYGLEAITAVFFLLCGCTALFTAMARKSYGWLTLTAICFSLSVWAYHSNRLFVPLLVIFLFVSCRQRLTFALQNKGKLALVLGSLALFAVPFLFLGITTPAVSQRAAMTSILREQSLIRSLHYGDYSSIGERIFDNDLYLVWHHWLGKYTDYFDLRFWFWKGLVFTPPGYPDSGLMYLVDLPLLMAGVLVLFRSKNRFLKGLVVFWFFAGPLASSFTMNDQHTLRTLVWLPFFGMVIASGWAILSPKLRALAGLAYMVALVANIAFVKDLYVNQFPRYQSEYYQYGFKQAAVYACEHLDEYEHVTISPIFGSLGPLLTGIPDYYVLFYCKYPPVEYQTTHRIEKFSFEKVDWRNARESGLKTLLISARWDYPLVTPPEEQVLKRIDYFNEMPAFYFVTTELENSAQ